MKFNTTKRDISFLEKARFSYTIRGLNKAAQWTQHLISNIKNQEISDYRQDFREIEIGLEQEIESRGAYLKKCYIEIKKIFVEAQDKPLKPLLEDIFPYADNYMSTLPNIKTIFEVSENPHLTTIERYFLKCFLYLVVIEGVFKNWIKILYYLFYNTKKGPIRLEQIDKDNLTNLINTMTTHGVDDIFDFYDKGHYRNAIAHAHINYDTRKNKMHFKNWDKGKLKWEGELTLEEFMLLGRKSTTFSDLCLDVVYLLVIHDICFVKITN